jgi:hypothetical protein
MKFFPANKKPSSIKGYSADDGSKITNELNSNSRKSIKSKTHFNRNFP